MFPLPSEEGRDVFSYKLLVGSKPEWKRWEEDIDSSAPLPRDIFACQVCLTNVLEIFILKNRENARIL